MPSASSRNFPARPPSRVSLHLAAASVSLGLGHYCFNPPTFSAFIQNVCARILFLHKYCVYVSCAPFIIPLLRCFIHLTSYLMGCNCTPNVYLGGGIFYCPNYFNELDSKLVDSCIVHFTIKSYTAVSCTLYQ
uniref:Putative secreted protein n=1 Tax=Amblyomma triste TaxID=251400 RepID=A0A023G2D9_AMBTT